MQNLAIGIIAVIVIIGGIILLSGDNSSPVATTETSPTTQEANMEQDTMAMDETTTDTMDTEAETTMEEPDIVDTAVATEDLSTLVTAVTEAELVTTLQGEGPFTVFAPTNAAFASLPAGTLETLLIPDNQADLQSILTYHVVPGEVLASDLADGMTVETVNGEILTFGVDASGVTINGSATVTMADITTSNGVVHVIDSVLLPPSE
jgi:uncharacterized surface protein with fasciclin (FAS1) repeats